MGGALVSLSVVGFNGRNHVCPRNDPGHGVQQPLLTCLFLVRVQRGVFKRELMHGRTRPNGDTSKIRNQMDTACRRH